MEQDRLLAVLPENHFLAHLEKFPVAALCDEPFMLLEKRAKAEVSEIFDTEHQLKELGEILKYANDYQTNKVYNFRYKKSKDPDAYFRYYYPKHSSYQSPLNMK